jgi:hypothetical protein
MAGYNTRYLDEHPWVSSDSPPTPGYLGSSITPIYEYQSFDIFQHQSRENGGGRFPVLFSPECSPGNAELGNRLVRHNTLESRKRQRRRLMGSYMVSNTPFCNDRLENTDVCCHKEIREPCRQCYDSTPEAQASCPRKCTNYDFSTNESQGDNAHEENFNSITDTLPETSWVEDLLKDESAETPRAKSSTIYEVTKIPFKPLDPYAGEIDLEARVLGVLGNDPGLAQAVLCKLNDQLPFISPLFCDTEGTSILGDSPQYSSPAYECGSSGSPSATPSSSQTKSSSYSSGMTPATSIASGKDELEEDGEDKDSPRKERPKKRQKTGPSKQQKVTGRRRLRCHFNAKCPTTHNQKACIMSGWLSIHNLRYVVAQSSLSYL